MSYFGPSTSDVQRRRPRAKSSSLGSVDFRTERIEGAMLLRCPYYSILARHGHAGTRIAANSCDYPACYWCSPDAPSLGRPASSTSCWIYSVQRSTPIPAWFISSTTAPSNHHFQFPFPIGQLLFLRHFRLGNLFDSFNDLRHITHPHLIIVVNTPSPREHRPTPTPSLAPLHSTPDFPLSPTTVPSILAS